MAKIYNSSTSWECVRGLALETSCYQVIYIHLDIGHLRLKLEDTGDSVQQSGHVGIRNPNKRLSRRGSRWEIFPRKVFSWMQLFLRQMRALYQSTRAGTLPVALPNDVPAVLRHARVSYVGSSTSSTYRARMTGHVLRLSGSLAATLAAYGLYRLAKFIYSELTSPLHDFPGPKSPSLLYGNFKEIYQAENSVLHEKWVEEYGSTLKYKGILGMTRLYTTDVKALNHVLMNSYIYQKPESARYNVSRMVGPGVLVVEGDKHRQQRRIMNPAFSPAYIRELTEIFIEKSIQLRDIWAAESSKQGGTGRIDVLSWLSKATLDVIGLAGFNYRFDALSSKKNELNDAFAKMFRSGQALSIIPMLKAFFPFLRFLPTRNEAEIAQSHKTMFRIANELLTETKAVVAGTGEKQGGRDLLSLLVQANMATDLPESQRMSDEDVLAQVPTFFVAGHETTSSATTWALFALTQDMRVQSKLREELLTVDTDNPTMDQLNALPYLDMVVRETLRVHAPVPSTVRVAVQDDILPLGTPVTDRRGRVHDSVMVKKGQTMIIPILVMNRAKSIWGEDAKEFRPERWESIPEATNTIPGVWGNMLTFLAGPRACIGYRFSLIEMKALIFTLVRALEFELAVPAKDIVKKSAIVQRPVLLTDPDGGNQMPLLIKPYSRT